ncbi:hypothetical protein CDD83_9845 [Cordyceps sp. RAO-2017]|nr:hypothetical protein CDD83_9845 [Cordyceps sp. RAO-2017]
MMYPLPLTQARRMTDEEKTWEAYEKHGSVEPLKNVCLTGETVAAHQQPISSLRQPRQAPPKQGLDALPNQHQQFDNRWSAKLEASSIDKPAMIPLPLAAMPCGSCRRSKLLLWPPRSNSTCTEHGPRRKRGQHGRRVGGDVQPKMLCAPCVRLARPFVLSGIRQHTAIQSWQLSTAFDLTGWKRKAHKSVQEDPLIGRRHDCHPPPELPKRWPLGTDRIKQLWDSNADGRLLAFLCSVAKDYEPQNSLCQFLLFGPRAYHVIHPKNVEALLSTNFKGQWSPAAQGRRLCSSHRCRTTEWGVDEPVSAPLPGNGIFTQEEAAWKHFRDLL